MSKFGTISDYITWLLMTNSAVVVNNNGTIMKTYTFQGTDTTRIPEEDVDRYILSVNNAIMRLPQDYMMFFESQKRKDTEYLPISDANPLQREFDEDRKLRVNHESYTITSYLTIVYKQPAQAFEEIGNVIDADNKTVLKTLKSLGKDFLNVFNPSVSMKQLEAVSERYRAGFDGIEASFLDQCEQITGMLRHSMPDIRPLTTEETLTYLHSTISDRPHPIKSGMRSFLSQQLSDATLVAGRQPMLGDSYIGVISIKDIPEETEPDILGRLRSLKSEYRYCVRWLALDKTHAKATTLKIVDRHTQRSKSMLTMALEAISQKDSGKIDESALHDADEARQMNMELEQGTASLGHLSISIVLLNEDLQELKEEMKEFRDAINDQGFVAFIDKENAVETWLSTIPSVYEYNVRRFLQPSLTMAAVAPLSAVWEGQKKNERLKGPALLKCKTREHLPFYLSLHVKDNGHTFIAGPTGSGKSVLLNTISAHFQKYENARVYIFDKSASSRVLTEGMGGNFYNLLVDTESISFQPLARIDVQTEQDWFVRWLKSYAESKHMVIDATDERVLEQALRSMANQPVKDRTLTALSVAVQSEKWRLALSSLLIPNERSARSGGLYGALFDSDEDKFGTGRWQTFEMDKLMQDDSIVSITLDYLFHRIESTLDGSPTLIVLDECWLFLLNEQFRKKIIDYIRTLRKANASIIMATQNVSDITEEMVPIVVNNMDTKIFLANPNMNEISANIYQLFGCNKREVELISHMKTKEEYFYMSSLGSRIFSLDLLTFPNSVSSKERHSIESIFVTSTDIADQAKAIDLLHTVDSHADFINKWKRYKPYTTAHDMLAILAQRKQIAKSI